MEKNLIIDSHVHITAPEIIHNKKRYRKSEPYFDLLSSSPKNKYTTFENLIDHMEKVELDRAVVFGFGFNSTDLCRRANDYTIEAVKRFPDKLIGYAVINPLDSGVESELERCRRAGLSGVGELFPTGQGFNITAKGQMEALCAFCQSYDWPILIHINEPVGHYYPGKTKDSIREGAALAKNFPQNSFIFAHMGGGLCFYEAMPELKESLKKVCYDTAAVPYLYDGKIYEALKAMGLLEKILLASDYPLISTAVYRKDLDQTSLSAEEKELILGKNIRAILGI